MKVIHECLQRKLNNLLSKVLGACRSGAQQGKPMCLSEKPHHQGESQGAQNSLHQQYLVFFDQKTKEYLIQKQKLKRHRKGKHLKLSQLIYKARVNDKSTKL